MQLARVVGVGIDCGHLKGGVLAAAFRGIDPDDLPLKRRRDLQQDACERDLAVVAHRDHSAHGDLLGCFAEMHIQIEIGKRDGPALSVFGKGPGACLNRGLRRLCGGLPIRVGRAGENHFSVLRLHCRS
jgi:hypothetical protein